MSYLPINPAMLQVQSLLLRQAFEELNSVNKSALSSYSESNPSDFEELILAACKRHNLDPALLKGLIKAESGFDPLAESSAGAKGLMQLMDSTAESLGVTDSFDPEQNIEAGATFLRSLLDRYNGSEELALAAYNAGPGRVDKCGGIPDIAETQTYVPRVLSFKQAFSKSTWEA